MRRLLIPFVVAAAVASLAGCGKAGRPVQPPDSQYPHIYPNPNLGPSQTPQTKAQPEQAPPSVEPRFTPGGSYVDPSVRATLNTPGAVQPGSNLPNSRTLTGNNPMEQGLGAPSMSPLPPFEPPTPEGQEQSQ